MENLSAQTVLAVPSFSLIDISDIPSSQDSLTDFLAAFNVQFNFDQDTVFKPSYPDELQKRMMALRRFNMHAVGVMVSEFSKDYPEPAKALLAGASKEEWITFHNNVKEGIFTNFADHRLRCASIIISAADSLIKSRHCFWQLGFLDLDENLIQRGKASAVTAKEGYDLALIVFEMNIYQAQRASPHVEKVVQNGFRLLSRYADLATSVQTYPWVRG